MRDDAVLLVQLAAPLLPARGLLGPVQAGRQAVRVDLQVVERAVGRGDQVGAPHRERIQAEPAGHLVEQRLEGVPRIDRAVAAHRAAGRQVGVDAKAPVAHRADAVQRVQQRAGVEDRHQAVAAVGAAALHDLAIDGGDLAAALHADLQPDVGGRPAAVGEETFLARELHAHRAAGRARQRGGDHLEVQRLDAMAEAAADEGLDDADARAVHAQHLRQRQVQVVGHLGHRMGGQAVGLGLVGGDRGVQLDLAVRHFGIAWCSARAPGRRPRSRPRRRRSPARPGARCCRPSCRAAARRPRRAPRRR